MEFIKKMFNAITSFLAKPVTYCLTKALELATPAFSWVTGKREDTPSFKEWLKLIAGVLVVSSSLLVTLAVGIVITGALTFILAFVLPLSIANLIAFVASLVYTHYLIDVAFDAMPDTITVQLDKIGG